jgi:hypothetical protein
MFSTGFTKIASARWAREFWKKRGIVRRQGHRWLGFNQTQGFKSIADELELKNKYKPHVDGSLDSLAGKYGKRVHAKMTAAGVPNVKDPREIAKNFLERRSKRMKEGRKI